MNSTVAKKFDDRAERSIMIIANIIKAIGVFLWVVCALVGFGLGREMATNFWGELSVGLLMAYFWGGVFIGFICWLGCYLTWAVLKVFTNISNTLYRIEAKQE